LENAPRESKQDETDYELLLTRRKPSSAFLEFGGTQFRMVLLTGPGGNEPLIELA